MRKYSFGPVAALAAALGISAASISAATGLAFLHPVSNTIPAPRRRNKAKRVHNRTGLRYEPGNGERENARNARLAAKMRATRSMNDDMLVSHRPKNSGPGMDIARPSRQVLRAEQRRTAKTRASRMKDARVPANWRQFIELDKATAAAQAAG